MILPSSQPSPIFYTDAYKAIQEKTKNVLNNQVDYLEAISKTLQQEFNAAEAEETEEVVGQAFVANDQAAEVAEVGEQPFDLPAPFVAPEFSAVLSLRFRAVAAVRGDELNALLG